MKATGIVRRIDDLGRVVIPKEIRRTLHIREGDPLEIYTEKDGSVIFRKYSPMGDLLDSALKLCESLHDCTKVPVAVSDQDGILAFAGAPRKDLTDKSCSRELEKMIQERKPYRCGSDVPPLPALLGDSRYSIRAAVPIVSQGDLVGSVMMLTTESEPAPIQETDMQLLTLSAGFLGRQIEL